MSRDYIYKYQTPLEVLGDEETELVKDHFKIVPGVAHEELLYARRPNLATFVPNCSPIRCLRRL